MTTILQEQRQVTRELIASEPTLLSIVRPPAWISDGAGGQKRGPGTRIVTPPKRRFFAPVVAGPERIVVTTGERLVATHVIVGPYDDNIEEGDEFTVDHQDYKVIWVSDDRRYETRAEVVHIGD